VGWTKEVAKERISRRAERQADLIGRFFPHRREVGVRKGLMLSSFPDAKNSSKR